VETDEVQAVSRSRSGGPGAWCRGGKHVRVKLRSTREGVSLKQNYPALVLSMLEKLKPVVERGCPGAESMNIDLDEKTRGYFSTARKQADGWVIADLREEVSPPASAIPALSGDHVKDCDALAAHPADPQRNGAQGREDENIHAEKAMAACKAAVEQDPQNARLLFQLGRSYWVGERFEEAIEAFLEAGEQGHGGALAYLGDATLYGVADLDPDPEEAKNLYNKAAVAGFMPASSLSGEIVAGVEAAEEEVQEEQQETGGEPQYHHPKTIAALAGGDVKLDGKLSQKEQVVYMLSLIAGVQHQCPSIFPAPFNSLAIAAHLGQWMIQRFGFMGAMQFNAEMENGAYESTNQEGVDDGYAFVYGKDCQSRETGRFVGTVAGYFN
jgi:hypothetical protein